MRFVNTLKPKMYLLFVPAIRKRPHEFGQGHGLRLAAIEDGFDEVGDEMG